MSWGEVVKQTDSILDGVKDLLVNRYSVSNTPLYSLTTPLTYSDNDTNYKIISDVFYPPKSGIYKIKMSFDITLTPTTSSVVCNSTIEYTLKSLYLSRKGNSNLSESNFNTLFGNIGTTIASLSNAELNLASGSFYVEHTFDKSGEVYRVTKTIEILVYLEENSPMTIFAKQNRSRYANVGTKVNSVEIY